MFKTFTIFCNFMSYSDFRLDLGCIIARLKLQCFSAIMDIQHLCFLLGLIGSFIFKSYIAKLYRYSYCSGIGQKTYEDSHPRIH